MKHVKLLDQSLEYSNSGIGGKGLSLVKLMKYQFLVPRGIVVSASAFDDFLDYNNLRDKIERTLEIIYNRPNQEIRVHCFYLKSLIINSDFPSEIIQEIFRGYSDNNFKLVAVRSSANFEDGKYNSWAGKLDTFLNSSKSDLILNMKKCYASIFNERAIKYCLVNGVNVTQVKPSIIIQEMIQSEISGVVFTIHPTRRKLNTLVIEAAFGLGELLVSSKLSPDYYEVDKESLKVQKKIIKDKKRKMSYSISQKRNIVEILDQEISSSPALDDDQLIELSKIAILIEKYFKEPQDIEWCFYKGSFFILQTRSITSNQEKLDLNFDPFLFKKIYASKGLPFLYEDFISKNYIKWDNLIFCINGGDYVFANIKALEEIQEIGCKKSIEEILNTIDKLNRKVELCVELGQTLSTFDKKNTNICMALFQEILFHYGFLDHCFWDKVFIQSYKNDESKKKIELVTNFKNHIREKINWIFFKEDAIFQRLVRYLSEVFSITTDDLFWYTADEMLGLYEERIVDSHVLSERKKCALLINKSGITKIVAGNHAYNECHQFTSLPYKKDDILRGMVANNGGVIYGYVKKIIRNYDNFELTRVSISEMKKGEILVTETTDPELDEAIFKSSGILTEIGGMLSHAAISAREFNIPCIVGIENLTSLLKDGDYIELDSVLGKVSIKSH